MLFAFSGVFAQTNLVNNPGFESYTSCTNAYNQIWYCVGWTGVPGCPGITNVADYFNGCGTPGYAPPNVGPAWQIPHGGNSYIGITSANSLGNCREYAQTLLLDSLTPGIKYNVSYYANLGGNSYFSLASNKLGALFTTYQIPGNVTLPALNFAQVYTDTVITDTVGWYHFSESFIADSAYKYMTIGNFFDSAHVTTISLKPGASYAWYLIDDVYVGVDSTAGIPSINLYSPDTSFCDKHCIDFYDLSMNNPTSWQWFFPGADSLTSSLQNPSNICYNTYGSFDVTLIACNNSGCDTLILYNFINEFPQPAAPVVSQSNDTLFSSPGITFQWYEVDSGLIPGAVNEFFVPAYGGQYYVLITDSNGCGAASNTIAVTGIKQSSVGNWQSAIVPNPNDGSFTIDLSGQFQNENLKFKIVDALGNTIYQSKLMNNLFMHQYKFKLELENGIYFITVNSDGSFFSKKFIVNK